MFRLTTSTVVHRLLCVHLNCCDGICGNLNVSQVNGYKLLTGKRIDSCRLFCSNDGDNNKKITPIKESEVKVEVKSEKENIFKFSKKKKDLDKGSLTNWFRTNYGERKPKNMPTDSSQLDSLDRIAITSSNEDYDYQTVNMVASFYDTDSKDWESYKQIIEQFKKPGKSGMRVGQVEFIYGSLKRLKDFGLHKDTRAYNALLNVFPKEKMLPENIIQAGFLHYAKQQFCAIDLLEEMEHNLVCPDQETVDSVIAIFGKRSHVFEKMGSMIYWTTKARYSDPYPMPNTLPLDPKELAKISFRRMSLDLNSEISVYSTEGVPDSIDKTWIVSSMSPVQKSLINRLNEPLFIDGPHIMWLKDHMTSYFVLKTTAPKEIVKEEKDYEDMRDLPLFAYGGLSKSEHIARIEGLHKTEEGTICGLVATGTSSRDSLLSYIRILQYHIPKIKELSIIFKQRAPETAIGPVNENEQDSNQTEANDEKIKLIVNK
ncbi:evolutionarily conserved signaling intermediate in Toll pathway, mitochondrial-like [Panonychus citri]|uniref:evolutionarily conserved signaling intermediate in Toll pathway, mitochondrial-like n=1 Tax=Panonychus citri TaxID=50023 RepID=UPI002307555D|nr:evolutionarily conserved signaling intermediate in Toll pathway, mitochondrial-like [Panonychus citri]